MVFKIIYIFLCLILLFIVVKHLVRKLREKPNHLEEARILRALQTGNAREFSEYDRFVGAAIFIVLMTHVVIILGFAILFD